MDILDTYKIKQFLKEDKFIWDKTKIGNFITKLAYLLLF